MKITLSLEEFALTCLGIYALYLHNLGLPFWVWFLLFFSPDISMLGYLMNTRVGAFFYNLFHHKGMALFIMGIGFGTKNEILIAIGLLLFSHSSFDRIMGYGLKYFDDFKHTHLGWLGDKMSSQEPSGK